MAEAKYLDSRGRIIAPGIGRSSDLVPVNVRLPSFPETNKLSEYELIALAQRYGIYSPFRDIYAQNAARVSQLTGLVPGTPEYDAAMGRIMAGYERKNQLLSDARSAQRNYNQLVAADGRPEQILVRVGEGDDAMCDGCMTIESAEGTYAEHEALGLPGTQECGGYCRCVLIPLDAPDAPPALLGGDEAAKVIGSILETEDGL